MTLQALAQDLRLAAGTQRHATGRLGRGDAVHEVGTATDQAMQLAVDGVDFLAQIVESGRVHTGWVILSGSGDTTSGRPCAIPTVSL